MTTHKKVLVTLAYIALLGVATPTIAQTLLPLAPYPLAGSHVPEVGTTHTFYDPIYTGTVFCDTFDQVEEIAMAKQPDDVYRGYMYQKNERNEPVCLAIVPTAVVKTVTPLGIMRRDGKHFNAWAVEVEMNDVIAFGLYLERVLIHIA